MKMRFRFKPRGQKARTMTVNVPRHATRWKPSGRTAQFLLFTREVLPEFIAAFEARHNAEVLEIRRPARRVRA